MLSFGEPSNQQPCFRKFRQCADNPIKSFRLGIDTDRNPHPVMVRKSKLLTKLVTYAIGAVFGVAAVDCKRWRNYDRSVFFCTPGANIFCQLMMSEEN